MFCRCCCMRSCFKLLAVLNNNLEVVDATDYICSRADITAIKTSQWKKSNVSGYYRSPKHIQLNRRLICVSLEYLKHNMRCVSTQKSCQSKNMRQRKNSLDSNRRCIIDLLSCCLTTLKFHIKDD